MINQLRIYTVPPANKGPFLDRFRHHAARIMARHGFRIQAMWTSETPDHLRFVYLLTWQDAVEQQAAWDCFMADKEWQQVKTQTSASHGQFLTDIEDMGLTPTDFSTAIGGTA
ncbi:NIPSNAP family protein [Actibacterium sp. 188UL27-1]|uniref:NIPSNAP family protein n=1 Tax=Actibacterium sp. 188UL27-1 TaxID=2786961 RepID=UPI001956A08B|nr:NIPSNAP family protein [Actibacterium sp. 188UL27-1]MBM7067967.1 NIPSNAP family protein [Actibacterium sp. 188UL27-1]